MDECLHTKGAYDFRRYDRVWQRVLPTLSPWGPDEAGDKTNGESGHMPDASAGMADADQANMPDTVGVMENVSANINTLPGAEPNPCCMGSEAMEDLPVLTGFIEEELFQRGQLLALSQKAPLWARQNLRNMSNHCLARARSLMAAHYLITGVVYEPAVCAGRTRVGRWCPELRERYHGMACTALNYARAAEGTADPCLGRLLESLSTSGYASASELLRLLERSIPS